MVVAPHASYKVKYPGLGCCAYKLCVDNANMLARASIGFDANVVDLQISMSIGGTKPHKATKIMNK